MSTQVLNQRQAKWSMSFSQFDIMITYYPSNLQGKPDALSHWSYLAPKEGDLILDQQKSIVLKPANFQLKALAMSSYDDASYFMEVQEALKDNPFVAKSWNFYISMKSMMNLNSKMDCFIFKNFCIHL